MKNSQDTRLVRFDAMTSIPAMHFADHQLWGTDVYVIPEYSFGGEVGNEEICLSGEHRESVWLEHETAQNRLQWDSSKTALWELHGRLLRGCRARQSNRSRPFEKTLPRG